MNAKWLVLLLAAGCAVPVDDEELDDTEQAMLNCDERDPDCTPYPEPTNPRRPDLVPVIQANPDGYCRWDGYFLYLDIKNTGTATAPATFAKLEFTSNTWGRQYSVPSLAPGAVYHFAAFDLRLDENCYGGRCRAKLTADANNAIAESSETNNTVTRLCNFHF